MVPLGLVVDAPLSGRRPDLQHVALDSALWATRYSQNIGAVAAQNPITKLTSALPQAKARHDSPLSHSAVSLHTWTSNEPVHSGMHTVKNAFAAEMFV